MNFVKYETAKLADDKGFGFDTLAYYCDGGLCNERIGKLGSYDSCYSQAYHDYKGCEVIPAPTQEELNEWLEQEHNLIVSTFPYKEADSPLFFYSRVYDLMNEELIFDSFDSESDTYLTSQEAMEAGLLDALNILWEKTNG